MIDKTARTFNVWIDGTLKGSNMSIYYDPNEILSLQFQVGWIDTTAYFDDVKVFSIADSSATTVPTQPSWIGAPL